MFNKPSEKISINSPDPNSDIYISEGERFNKDFALYEYNRRNIEHEKKKEMYQNKKNQIYERERKRWERMDYEFLRKENKIMINKEKNLVGRKNNPGMAFNPLTLQYDNSVQGEILKRRDDESKFRALMRATNIDKHANAGYNIINGQERNIMESRMMKEIEPSVYKKNIDKINEINARHNDNDNFYTKGPDTQIKEPIYQEQNEVKNDNLQNVESNTPQENYIKKIPINEGQFNNIQNDNIVKRTPKSEDFNHKNNYQNNFNEPRMTPNNNNYQKMSLNNEQKINYNKMNYMNNDKGEYRRTPYSENQYNNKIMAQNNNYYRPPPKREEFQNDIPDHYSEPDKKYKSNYNDFDRQYNYFREPNNYEDYKNQELNNNYSQNNNKINNPYARPDYYSLNRPKTMG